MNTKKWMKRIVCVFVLAAMVLTMLPTIVFAQSVTICVSYPSLESQYGAGGEYKIEGSSTSFSSQTTWYEIAVDGKDVEFVLTPPTNYPVPESSRTPVVYFKGNDISSRVTNNTFTISSADFTSDDVSANLNIYWSTQEKEYFEFAPINEIGFFPLLIHRQGMSCDTLGPSPRADFGGEQKLIVNPDNGVVTLTLSDIPTVLELIVPPNTNYNLLQSPIVKSGDDTMIEYSTDDMTITFHTEVGILKDLIIKSGSGITWPNLRVQKGNPGPGPGPGPQGPQAQIRNMINDNCGYIAFDPDDPTKAYVRYEKPLQYLYFMNIPIDDQGNKTTGTYYELIDQGFNIDVIWPEQASYNDRLEVGQDVPCEITLDNGVLPPLTLPAGSRVLYEGEVEVQLFKVAEPIEVTENMDGVVATDASGKYFKYNYQNKVKFNIEVTSGDGSGGRMTFSYYGVTIDDAMKRPVTGQRKFLVADMQETEHWEAGNTYDVYFALAGTVIKSSVTVVESDEEITYWEDQAEAAVNEIAPGNAITLKSIVPQNAKEATAVFAELFSKPNDEKYKEEQLSFILVPDPNDVTKGTINVYRTYASTTPGAFEPDFIQSFENIDISYDFDQEIAAEVDDCKQNFKTFDYNDPQAQYYENLYFVTDLDMINLVLNGGQGAIRDFSNIINFSTEFLNDVNRLNLETQLNISNNQQWEGRAPAMSYGCGQLLLLYDGTVYGIVDQVGYMFINIIYVPSETPRTEEALKTAAIERANQYVHGDVSDYYIEPDDHWQKPSQMVLGGMFSPDRDMQRLSQMFASMLGLDPGEQNVTKNTIDKIFRFEYKGQKMPLWVVADSEKMQKQEEVLMNTVDIRTKAGVSTSTDTSLPLDAKIAATQHIGDDIYNEQMALLGLDEGIVFDIDLNSEIRNGMVQTTEVENGFEVRIPVPDTYAGKTVYAYYTSETGEIEVHDATVIKDGEKYFAVFTTDHFSTYTIGEVEEETAPEDSDQKDKEEAVETGDQNNMTPWILLMAGAACVITGTVVLYTKRRKSTKK